jgi:hypothetical protein
MATSSSSNAGNSPTARSTPGRRTNSNSGTSRRSSSAGTRRSSATTSRSSSANARRSTGSSSRRSTASGTSTRARTQTNQVQHLAERAVLVPVGASLLAQENIVSTVRDLTTKYRTRASLERELKRYERRGATARNRFERQVRKTRTRFERELRQRRTTVERTVKQNRRRLEREVRSVRKDLGKQSGIVGARAQKLVADAQNLISSAS